MKLRWLGYKGAGAGWGSHLLRLFGPARPGKKHFAVASPHRADYSGQKSDVRSTFGLRHPHEKTGETHVR